MARRADLPHLLTLLDDEDVWVRNEALLALQRIEGSLLVLVRPYEPELSQRQWAALDEVLKPQRRAQVLDEWPSWAHTNDSIVALEQGYNRLNWAETGARTPSVTALLNALTEKFRETYPSPAIDYLMEFLFEHEGLGPPQNDFFHPDYSHLGAVLLKKQGLQISLSVIAVLLGSRLRLPVFGFNNPGHFMILTRESDKICFRDPFQRGKNLVQSALSAFPPEDTAMAFDAYAAKPVAIFSRVLSNLMHACKQRNLVSDLEYYQQLFNRIQRSGQHLEW